LGKKCGIRRNNQKARLKRSELFIRFHRETLSIIAVCIDNPDRLPVDING
jgi:hypothetical protein